MPEAVRRRLGGKAGYESEEAAANSKGGGLFGWFRRKKK
jgi:hypothetical protein